MGSPATRLGDVLNDAYELQELVGANDSREVYRARDTRTRTPVRITLLRPEFALQGAVVERFLRGPRSLTELTHQSLPRLYVDSDETGIPFVVEEAVEGRTLASLIGSFAQGLPLELTTEIYAPLVEALALAHREGIVHGSLDEAHVLLLGAAHAPAPKLLGLGTDDDARATQDAGYRAPELSLSPEASPTPQADVYALGVLLYRMLSGELPFRSGKKSLVPLDEVAPHVPRPWLDLTRACLEPKAAKRLENAGAVLTHLQACTRPTVAPAQVIGSLPTVSAEFSEINQAANRQRTPPPKAEKTRKQAAKEATAKLSAKARPTQPGTTTPLPAASAPTPLPQPSARETAPVSPKPARKPAVAMTQGQVAAVALTEAQLNAIRALRTSDDSPRDRWVGALLLLLFLFLLVLGVPLLYEPEMATARATFGPNLRIAVTGFAVVALIGAIHLQVAQLRGNSLVQRVTSALMFVVTGCIVLLMATLYMHAPGLELAAGLARRALPWGSGFLFFLWAWSLLLRGARQLASDVAYGALALLMASGSLYGSYRTLAGTVLKDKHKTVAVQPTDTQHPTPSLIPRSLTDIKKQLSDKLSLSKWQQEHQDDKNLSQRNEIGANEEEDMKSLQELHDTRTKNKQALDHLGEKLPNTEAASQ